jgi:hypothetical protein
MSTHIRANLIALAFESLTPDAAAGPNAASIAGANGLEPCMVEITTNGQALFYKVSGGSDPTTSVGMRIPAGSKTEIWGKDNLRRLRFINAVAGGVIGLTFYGSRAL